MEGEEGERGGGVGVVNRGLGCGSLRASTGFRTLSVVCHERQRALVNFKCLNRGNHFIVMVTEYISIKATFKRLIIAIKITNKTIKPIPAFICGETLKVHA